MAAFATAGTLAAAVLETAGYLNQQYILDQLGRFISAFGVLLFLVVCIGALISVALFGSYRYAAQILILPTVFVFMLAERGQTFGTLWKIGASDPLNQLGRPVSAAQALSLSQQLASEETPGSANAAAQPISISFFFATYAKVVDKLVASIRDIILPLKDQAKNTLFINRTYAFETLLNAKFEENGLLQMFQGDLMSSCNGMMRSAIALASPQMSVRRQTQLENDLNSGIITDTDVRRTYASAVGTLNKNRTDQEDALARGRAERFSPSPALRSFIRQQLNDPAPNETKVLSIDEDLSGSLEQISCGTGWAVIRDAIRLHADALSKKLLETYGDQLGADTQGKLCISLARAVGFDLAEADEDRCRDSFIVELTGLFLMRNALATTGLSGAVRDIQNRMELVDTIKEGTLVGEDGLDDSLFEAVENQSDVVTQLKNTPHQPQRFAAFYLKNDPNKKVIWRPVRVLQQEVLGHMDSAFKSHQRFQTRELRQKIFTAAAQLPYYQGLILYLLASAFPFFALILVIPGRAGSFLNYLLAWLWVKSWDIGFALVIVLDRVLWNIFPSTDFENASDIGRAIGPDQSLPILIREAFRIDPAYNVHAYYFIMSSAIFAIPPMMGLLTLKLRRGMAESVAEPLMSGMISSIDSAASRAGYSFGQTMINERQLAMEQFKGAALLCTAFHGENGIEKPGRAESADFWANKVVAPQAGFMRDVTKLPPHEQHKQLLIEQKADLFEKAKTPLERGRYMIAEAEYEGRLAQAFNGPLARFSKISLMSDAYAGAMDGFGSNELFKIDMDGLYGTPMAMAAMKLRDFATAEGWEASREAKDIGKMGIDYDLFAHGWFEKSQAPAMAAIDQWITYIDTSKNLTELQFASLTDDPEKQKEIRAAVGEILRYRGEPDTDENAAKLLSPTLGNNADDDKLFESYASSVTDLKSRFDHETVTKILSYDPDKTEKHFKTPPIEVFTDEVEESVDRSSEKDTEPYDYKKLKTEKTGL